MKNDTRSREELLKKIAELRRELDDLKRIRPGTHSIESHLRSSLFDENPLMLFLIDAAGIVKTVNRKGGEQLGYEPRELMNRSLLDVFHPEDRQAAQHHVAESLKNPERTLTWELRKVRKDGTIIWVKEFAKPIVAEDGRPQVYIACEDITEAKQVQLLLRQSEERFQAIVDQAFTGIVLADLSGHIIRANDRFCAITGYGRNNLLGRHFAEITHPEDLPDYRMLWESLLRTAKPFFALKRYIRPDGSTVWVNSSVTLITDTYGKPVNAVVMVQDISEHKRAEEALTQSEAQFKAIFNSLQDVAVFTDTKGRIVLINPAFTDKFGYTLDEVKGRTTRFLHADSADFDQMDQTHTVPGEKKRSENLPMQYQRKDGTRFWGETAGIRVRNGEGNLIGYAGISRDITENKRIEERIQQAKGLSEALNRINQLIHSTLNTDEIMQRAICEAAAAIGIDAASIGLLENDTFVMKQVYNLPEELGKLRVPAGQMKGVLFAASVKDVVAFNDAFNDERVNIEMTRRYGARSEMIAPFVIRGDVVGAMIFYSRTPHVFTDIELDFTRKLSASLSLALENARLFLHRKQMEEEMRHMAHHDPLTGLPNRRLFLDIIDLECVQADRNRKRMAILFLDLDRFKEVNDTLGHDAGNKLLKEVSTRLKLHVRKSDTIARIGGDEFNIILSDIARPEDTADVARNIISSFRKPFRIDGQELSITTSVGISIYPDDSDETDTLLRYADIAMYHAKEQGRNQYQFYNSSINVKSLERIRLETMLKRSLDQGEMEMYYQPLVDITSRRIVGAEALARWRHPDRGLLLPQDFILAAEETGFISELGEWALKAVCMQLKGWKNGDGPKVRVTVNLSARQFQDPNLIEKISSIMKEADIQPGTLGIEITETIAMSNVERSADRMKELSRMGVQVCIDDFGTGYSSLNYLKRLPIERLKIDQTFVKDIVSDPDDRSIVKAVTAMAHSMKMRVVAEGVETEEQLKFLKKTGCDEMQGYLFSKPLKAGEFEELLKAA